MKLFFFGYSICNGQFVNINEGFVNKISNKLKKSKKKILVTNNSVDGRTTRQALEDMPFQIQKHKPIVCKPDEALRCFISHGIDLLVIGNYVINKKDF